MKKSMIIIVLWLFCVELHAQALQDYYMRIKQLENQVNSESKSAEKGKALVDFYYARMKEVDKETTRKETYSFLRQYLDYDFHAGLMFFVKIPNAAENVELAKIWLNENEKAMFQPMSNYLTAVYNARYNQTAAPVYPSSLPQFGTGLIGSWEKSRLANRLKGDAVTQHIGNKVPLDNGEAEFRKGYQYDQVKNYIEAMYWYKKAAEKAYSSAFLNMGVLYFNGKGVPQNYVEAMNWYKQAAERNNAQATYYVGTMYYMGHGVEKNETEAKSWFQKAADKGYEGAKTALKELQLRAIDGTTELNKGLAADDAKSYEEAMNWYKKAAAKGNDKAMHNIGLLYSQGKGFKEDYSEALGWYQQAASKGNPKSMYNLGTMYHEGKGVTQNYAEALHQFKKAAENGEAEAMHNIGVMYYYGQGMTKNVAEAKLWFQKAVEKGYESSRNALKLIAQMDDKDGGNMENGRGTAAYQAKKYTEAMQWYIAASGKGHAAAMFHIGAMYYNGEGVEKNYAESIKWYEKAAEKGHIEAKSLLQLLREQGRQLAKINGAEENEQGNRLSKENNFTDALISYKKAAEKGSALGTTNVGIIYFKGQGVVKDVVEAEKWFQRAAVMGEDSALYLLGLIYYQKKEDKQAKEYLQKAIQMGNKQAEEFFKKAAW